MIPLNIDRLYSLFVAMGIGLAIAVPIAIWKVVEIVLWLFS